MSVKVSMVIPCYNKDKYIGDMLESVLKQKWDNIEVIIVNDGSTDGTFNAIERYVPKFLSRGFEVVLVNQENLGVASAVKNGLMRVTGKYVCFPDCDDLLHHEYVSAMVEILERFSKVDIVVCDDVRNRWSLEPLKDQMRGEHLIDNTQYLITNWILGKVMPSICTMLIRLSTIKEIKIIENFITSICTTQEPQVWLPLLAEGKSIYYLERPLYISIKRTGSIMTSQNTVDSIFLYAKTRKSLIETVLKIYISSSMLEFYKKLADIAFFDLIARRLSQVGKTIKLQTEIEREFVSTVNDTGVLPIPLTYKSLERTGFRIAYYAICNCITGYVPANNDSLDAITNIKGRLIAYGAGNVARQILPCFIRFNIIPSLVWDKNSNKGESILNLPCVVPDFDSIKLGDIIILFLNGNRDVEEEMKKNNIRYLYYNEILNELATKQFPELVEVKHV
ncbi:hypothetical protein LXJ15735_03770 [Lacrimispora xylanolytica]